MRSMSCKWLLCVTFLIAQLFEGKGLHRALTWSDVELLGSFLQTQKKVWTERSESGSDSCCCGDEAAQSQLRTPSIAEQIACIYI